MAEPAAVYVTGGLPNFSSHFCHFLFVHFSFSPARVSFSFAHSALVAFLVKHPRPFVLQAFLHFPLSAPLRCPVASKSHPPRYYYDQGCRAPLPELYCRLSPSALRHQEQMSWMLVQPCTPCPRVRRLRVERPCMGVVSQEGG